MFQSGNLLHSNNQSIVITTAFRFQRITSMSNNTTASHSPPYPSLAEHTTPYAPSPSTVIIV